MTTPTPLSPAAQKVLDAADWELDDTFCLPHALAAALRAAVDQVAPEKWVNDVPCVDQSYVDGSRETLDAILAIAAELDGGAK